MAVITLDNPPVNGLGHAARSGIVAGVERANADAAVDRHRAHRRRQGVLGRRRHPRIQHAQGDRGADAEHGDSDGRGERQARRRRHRRRVHGRRPGAGAGMPLAGRGSRRPDRAARGASLGLLPGAGGTQRLPRVVGVETALRMIVGGASVAAVELRGTRIFDAIVDGDLLEGALAFARRIVAEARPSVRVRDLEIDCPDAAGIFQAARDKASVEAKGFPAPQKCIDAVAAAVALPFDDGLRVERQLFLELVQSTESRALRHAFFAERAAARIPDVPETTPTRKIGSIGVVGAGTMGTGIAMNALNAGIPAVLLEMSREALDKGVATIRRNYEGSVQRGRITRDKLEQCMALLRPTLSYDDLRDADLVIEAVFEEMDLKRQVFGTLDGLAKPGAILATNTSTLDVNVIAAATRRPQDVIGMHFFSPANVMKLLEVVRGAKTGSDVLMTVMQFAKTIGKTAVVSGVCDGFIGNRMLEQYLRQAMFLLEEGAAPQQVDGALEAFGMAMGPFRMSDLAGNDVGWRIRKRRYVEKPHLAYSRIADRLCESGRFGQKTAWAGIATKPDGARRSPTRSSTR